MGAYTEWRPEDLTPNWGKAYWKNKWPTYPNLTTFLKFTYLFTYFTYLTCRVGTRHDKGEN